jgi:hypothetical protein
MAQRHLQILLGLKITTISNLRILILGSNEVQVLTLPVRLVTVSGPGSVADLFAILFESAPKNSFLRSPVSVRSPRADPPFDISKNTCRLPDPNRFVLACPSCCENQERMLRLSRLRGWDRHREGDLVDSSVAKGIERSQCQYHGISSAGPSWPSSRRLERPYREE